MSLKRNMISIDCGQQRLARSLPFPFTVPFYIHLIISSPNESFVRGIPALNIVIHQARVHLQKCALKAAPILLP